MDRNENKVCDKIEVASTTLESASIKTVSNIVDSFDEEDPDSYDNVENIVDLGESAVPEVLVLLDSEDLTERWAAVYALSRVSHDADDAKKKDILVALRKAFDDDDPTIRQTAAGTAVGLGETDGFPILIDYLRSDYSRLLSAPPRSMSSYSIRVLRYYAGKDFGYDLHVSMNQREVSIKKWENWWSENKDNLVWVPDMKEYGGYRIET